MSGLPNGWVRTTLEAVTRHRSGNGKLIKGKQKSEPHADLFPAFSASGQDIWVSAPEHSGDAIIVSAVGARCGKAFLASGKWSAVANTHIVWPYLDAVDAKWLWLKLNNENFWIKGGSAQPFVKVGATFERELNLPPAAEQRRTAAKVDALMARTARARADMDRIPPLAERFRGAVLSQYFDIDSAPSNARLEEVTPHDAKIIYGILQPGPDMPSGVPYVRPTEIVDGRLELDAMRRTSPQIAERYKRSTLAEGDVLLSIVGTIGKVAVVPANLAGANITQSSCRIRPRADRLTSSYLRYFLLSPLARKQYGEARLGTAVPRLNLEDVRDIKIPLRPVSEQTEIVRRIEAAFAEIDRLTAESAAARRLLDRLDQAVLDKAFRGELVPQDPTDEPASILLERIRAERAGAPIAKRGRRAAA